MGEVAHFIPGFIAAYLILLVGASSPGPSVALLIGIATTEGRTPALLASLGVAFGSATINVLTIFGVGLVLSQAAWAMNALRIIGAAYLLYLAYGAIKKSIHPQALQTAETTKQSWTKHFTTAYLLQISNPKAIAFWLSISAVGAVEGANLGVIALFIAGGFLISFSCHAAWAAALSIAKVRAAYSRGSRWIEAALGGFFVFAAFKLATSES
ncbi:MAG: LysE family translocator [Granulosicoccaceae bacterium]